MLSRLLSLLIAAAYVVGQFAAVPHLHGDQSADHAAVRHVHLPTVGAHSHGQHRHCHHGHRIPTPESTCPDHDDGCIHLPGGSLESTPDKALSVGAIQVSFVESSGVAPLTDAHRCADTTITPPDILRSGCNLCLTLRTWRN